MKIPISTNNITKAIEAINPNSLNITSEQLAETFEQVYHCKIISDPNDFFCTTGWVEFEDEKYGTWFLLQFGD